MDDETDEQPAEPDHAELAGGADGHDILAIVLDKPTRANELLLALVHLQGEGKLRVHDAVIVTKDADGRSSVVETVDVTPARGAIAGAWFGLFGSLLVAGPAGLAVILGGAAAGALYGRLVDRGLDDEWVKGMSEWIDPGTSALLLLVDSGFDEDVVGELRRFEGAGEVAYSTLPRGVRDEIESALSGADREPAD
jgi:uncharacterized membrane protein